MKCFRLASLVGLAAIASLTPACNIVAPIAIIFAEEPEMPAQFTLENIPTVVFVDDRSSRIPLSATSIRRVIADRASQDLIDAEMLTVVIAPGDAMGAARSRDKHGELTSIGEIATAVGAEQIIYVEMIAFKESPDGATPRPIARCKVSVLNVERRERVFPADGDNSKAISVNAQLPTMDPQLFQSPATRIKVHKQLAEMLGQQIGWLFYDHKIYEIGDRLSG